MVFGRCDFQAQEKRFVNFAELVGQCPHSWDGLCPSVPSEECHEQAYESLFRGVEVVVEGCWCQIQRRDCSKHLEQSVALQICPDCHFRLHYHYHCWSIARHRLVHHQYLECREWHREIGVLGLVECQLLVLVLDDMLVVRLVAEQVTDWELGVGPGRRVSSRRWLVPGRRKISHCLGESRKTS